MTIVVAGSTLAIQAITQNRVEDAYTRLFSDQFQSQIRYFSERQQNRLQTLKEICSQVASSPTLTSFLSEDPGSAPEVAAQEISDYVEKKKLKSVFTPLADSITPEEPSKKKTSSPKKSDIQWMNDAKWKVMLIDSNGRPVTPYNKKKGVVDPASAAWRKDDTQNKLVRLLKLHKPEKEQQEQQTGFAIFGDENDEDATKTTLMEVVWTGIPRQGDLSPLPPGALMVAIPFSEEEETAYSLLGAHSELGELKTGVWIGQKIYRTSIDPESSEIIARRIGEALKEKKETSFHITIKKIPYRVIFTELNPDSPFPPACQVSVFSLEKAKEEENDLAFAILTSGALALAGSLLAIMLVSRGLTRPIHNLLRGTKEIREGNFNIRVPVKGKDEIGELSASFNEMAKGLALNQRYHTVLTQVADKGIARALMRGEVRLGGELREVSVLFCDIRGFTAFTEGMNPEEVIILLNEHMTAMTEIVHKHHGVVDKFVGDLIMAIFGAPVASANDTQNAAKCAIEMIERRRQLNQSSLYQLAVGIGLTTGTNLVGCMGSINRLDYTVLGEKVNLASRLCDAAARMEVLVDDTTKEKLGEGAEAESLADLTLKGFAEPISAWRLKRVR